MPKWYKAADMNCDTFAKAKDILAVLKDVVDLLLRDLQSGNAEQQRIFSGLMTRTRYECSMRLLVPPQKVGNEENFRQRFLTAIFDCMTTPEYLFYIVNGNADQSTAPPHGRGTAVFVPLADYITGLGYVKLYAERVVDILSGPGRKWSSRLCTQVAFLRNLIGCTDTAISDIVKRRLSWDAVFSVKPTEEFEEAKDAWNNEDVMFVETPDEANYADMLYHCIKWLLVSGGKTLLWLTQNPQGYRIGNRWTSPALLLRGLIGKWVVAKPTPRPPWNEFVRIMAAGEQTTRPKLRILPKAGSGLTVKAYVAEMS